MTRWLCDRKEERAAFFFFFNYRHNISWPGRMPLTEPGNWESAVFNPKGMQLAFKPKLGTLLKAHLFISYLYELRSHFLLLLLKVLSSTFPPISVCLGKWESRARYDWCPEIFLQNDPFFKFFFIPRLLPLKFFRTMFFSPQKNISAFLWKVMLMVNFTVCLSFAWNMLPWVMEITDPICLLKAFLLDRLVCSDSNKHSCLQASSLHLRGSWKTPQTAESDHE